MHDISPPASRARARVIALKNSTTQPHQPSGQEYQPADKQQCQQEAFTALAAAFKRLGHALTCIDVPNGATRYYASNWGYAKPLASLDEARAFLEQIGGEL